jgi:hypothetical protein
MSCRKIEKLRILKNKIIKHIRSEICKYEHNNIKNFSDGKFFYNRSLKQYYKIVIDYEIFPDYIYLVKLKQFPVKVKELDEYGIEQLVCLVDNEGSHYYNYFDIINYVYYKNENVEECIDMMEKCPNEDIIFQDCVLCGEIAYQIITQEEMRQNL